MTTQAQADHVMAETRTLNRRSQELSRMAREGAPDPAVSPEGNPRTPAGNSTPTRPSRTPGTS